MTLLRKRLVTLHWRHGKYGYSPNGEHFTKFTTRRAWRGFAVRVGKRWHGIMICDAP